MGLPPRDWSSVHLCMISGVFVESVSDFFPSIILWQHCVAYSHHSAWGIPGYLLRHRWTVCRSIPSLITVTPQASEVNKTPRNTKTIYHLHLHLGQPCPLHKNPKPPNPTPSPTPPQRTLTPSNASPSLPRATPTSAPPTPSNPSNSILCPIHPQGGPTPPAAT
ncbi:hypothetical protein EV426DRAFT_590190 [Tirmania nivea]|nr:hypothetical protein EV426DRAFT_590190 [Tirmania nivea]